MMRKTIISVFTAILFITASQLILDIPGSIAFSQTDDHGTTKEDATHIAVGIVRPGVVDVGANMPGVIETSGKVATLVISREPISYINSQIHIWKNCPNEKGDIS